jgi:hypothetical protein
MGHHRYATTSIYGDYARAGFGLALTVPPLLLLDPAPFFVWLLGGMAGLFGWFGARTWLRHARRVELSPEAIALVGPMPRRLAWARLERVKLAYYAPRRSREDGWMQLTLKGPGGPIRVDSNLEGFDRVAERTARAAADRGLEIDPVTEANFAAIGVELGEGDRER